MAHYECWSHRVRENYLVRLNDTNYITGVCGPFRQDDIPTVNMPNYDYDSQPRYAEWMRTHLGEFYRVDETPLIPGD